MASGFNHDRSGRIRRIPYRIGQVLCPIHKHFIWENRDAREITMLPKSWQSLQDLLEPMCIQDPKNSVQTAWRIVVIPSLAINTLNASVTCRKTICIWHFQEGTSVWYCLVSQNCSNMKQFIPISSWWFQPLWKILVKMGIFPKYGWK